VVAVGLSFGRQVAFKRNFPKGRSHRKLEVDLVEGQRNCSTIQSSPISSVYGMRQRIRISALVAALAWASFLAVSVKARNDYREKTIELIEREEACLDKKRQEQKASPTMMVPSGLPPGMMIPVGGGKPVPIPKDATVGEPPSDRTNRSSHKLMAQHRDVRLNDVSLGDVAATSAVELRTAKAFYDLEHSDQIDLVNQWTAGKLGVRWTALPVNERNSLAERGLQWAEFRDRDSGSGRWIPLGPPIDIVCTAPVEFQSGSKELFEIQRQLDQKLKARAAWQTFYLYALIVAVLFSFPYCWYFTLSRIKELSNAIRGR
jgi:hypothetical protein